MNKSKISKRRLRADFSHAASSYDAAAVVQHTICKRTLERVDMLHIQPNSILDIGTGTGRSLIGLQSRFPNSFIVANDIALPMLNMCNQNPEISQKCNFVCDEAQQLPFVNNSVELIFSTSTFQWCADLNQVLLECNRVLCKDGVLIFSTFGPGTLIELHNSWAQVDELEHVHEFLDMHHIGDMLLANQFVDPVVDMEVITIQYQALRQLLQDLKDTGSRGKFDKESANMSNGLMGKKKYKRLVEAYEKFRTKEGTLPASYEVIYGYARKQRSSHEIEELKEVKISVDQIKKTR